jgi:hypothetical protein
MPGSGTKVYPRLVPCIYYVQYLVTLGGLLRLQYSVCTYIAAVRCGAAEEPIPFRPVHTGFLSMYGVLTCTQHFSTPHVNLHCANASPSTRNLTLHRGIVCAYTVGKIGRLLE